MTNLSNFNTTLDFENHVLKNVIGRDFPIYGTGDQERGQLLEIKCFGKIKGNTTEDLKINKGDTWELKCFYGDKVHISKIKSKKNLKNKVYEKMKRLYLIERNNQISNVKFLRFYKLKELNKKKFLNKISIRYSKNRNYYEVYFKSISDLEYCYGDIKEVK
jgi:hypothetical protein